MPWDQGDLRARRDLDQPFQPFRLGVIGTVALTIHYFRALECRVQEVVTAAEAETPDLAVHVKLHPLPQSSTEILEVPETGLIRGDEKNILPVIGSKPSDVPIQFALHTSAQSGLDGAGDDLFKRRISGQGVGKFAGGIRVRASKLD